MPTTLSDKKLEQIEEKEKKENSIKNQPELEKVTSLDPKEKELAYEKIEEEVPPSETNPYATMERNLFKFCYKMGKYLFFSDQSVLKKDLGFEQMLYIVFMRRFTVFYLIIGMVVSLFIFAWARLTVSNSEIILRRLLGSRDLTLTDMDVNTFISSVYSTVLILYILHLRRMMANRLMTNIVDSEVPAKEPGQPVVHPHRQDVWFQIRTVKFFGLHKDDKRGVGLKHIINCTLKINEIEGSLLKHHMLPYLELRIKIEEEIEDINENYDFEGYEKKGSIGKFFTRM